MATRRYHLSTIEKAEQLVRLLDALHALGLDDGFRPSRPIGYAFVRVVDIRHPVDKLPDALVRVFDPLSRIDPAFG